MFSEVVHDVPTGPRGELTAEVSAPTSSRPVQVHTTAVTRRRATTGKDPLGALATLIAEALTEKLADTDDARVLRKLVGRANADRRQGPTVARLIDQYLQHADAYYRHPDGTPTREPTAIGG